MTREEAIAYFKDMNECTYGNVEPVQMAIEALEQEPCEDAVSRKAVLNLSRDLEFSKIKGMENYKHRCIEIEDVEELPSVMPDLSSLREINDALTKRVQFLETMNRYATPITPTHKKGEWCKQNDDYFDWYECSECGYGSEGEMQYSSECDVRTKYCPNCGAEMEEV